MKSLRNLGHHERIVRVGLGFTFLAASGFSIFPGWGDLTLMIVGLIALVTGIVGYCPAWHAIGIDTCKGDHRHDDSQSPSGPPEHHVPTTHQS